ncbi:hypothetical protein [Oxobacter pfennigii]|nr:hypothetical protein [Oxobacter pfennigii]
MRFTIGTFYELWYLAKADSRLSCLPLPLLVIFSSSFAKALVTPMSR